ncbi:MAG TPA: amidohydrolase family protein [Acidimicrobiales bacterium]|nr:amidohydrolase family protein [Acidimicrobiales bacterium]
MDAEIVIRGGTVIDGTGAPGRRADVAVADGRIVEVGTGLTGRRSLDASGHVVAPGFIDIHTHYDAQVFWDAALTPSSYHGVTTVIAGNCGFSIAPIRRDAVELMAHTLQHVEDMSFDTLSVGVPWDEFESFAQYLDAIERRGVTLNFGCYVGHTAVRLYVMGDDAYERAATPAEIARMQSVIAESLTAGAAGFATSANPAHNGDRGRPVPSRKADMDEVRALLKPVREVGKGVVAMLPGGVIPYEDMITFQREVGRPLTWTALLSIEGNDYHEKVIADTDAAHREGADVWPQVSCRPLVFQMNLEEPFTFNTRECFRALMDRPRSERVAAYRDPSWRARAKEELASGYVFRWHKLSVADSPSRPDLAGRPILDLAAELGVSPLDAVLDLSLEDDLRTRFWSVTANDDEDVVSWLLPRDNVLLGLADSGAHVSQLCDACFATDLLGQWVREREVMPLERAVHKLSGEPAAVYGLTDRGTVEAGKAADLVVFDPATVSPGPLHRVRDFPADGERLTADAPVGIAHVLVNGVPIREDGTPVPGARPGTVLRG